MGPAWLGLLGAVVGGLVSLIGTLVTTRVQWRQQRDTEMEKRESERRRDTIPWERTRDTLPPAQNEQPFILGKTKWRTSGNSERVTTG